MDSNSQSIFDELRKNNFPAHINYLKSHITLFHKLPCNESIVQETLRLLTKRKSFPVLISGLKHIGNGVIYTIDSPVLQDMHIQMQHTFKQWLCRQDAQRLQPHITVQNKATNYKSRELFNELTAHYNPFSVEAIGLQAWYYLNGPWELQEEFLFKC